MADVKISGLPASTVPLAGTEVLPIVQGGQTRQVSIANVTAGRSVSVANLTNAGLTAGRVTYAGTAGLLSDSANLFWDNANARLGISTTSPAYKVNAVVSSGADAFFADANAQSFSGYRIRAGASGQQWAFRGGNTSMSLTDATAGADRLVVFSSSGVSVGDTTDPGAGNLRLATGNLVIGTSGKGIDFTATPGTGTSELLADYEEGTWTPNQGVGLTVIGTFGSAGTYTKVGRIVTVNLSVTGTTSIAVSAGGIICSNLPFTAIADGIGSYGGGAQITTPTLITMYAYGSSVIATNASGAGSGLYMTITYTQG